MGKGIIVRSGKLDSDGAYHRIAAGICQQAFEDLKTAYVIECGYKWKASDGECFNSRGLEQWFCGEEYFFLTGYENGDVIIREAKRQADEIVERLRKGKKHARAV